MPWKNSIPGCFGCKDKKFAMHPNDIQRASDIIKEVNVAGDGWDDYLTAVEDWLTQQGCNQSHIAEQMKRVKDIENYFIYD